MQVRSSQHHGKKQHLKTESVPDLLYPKSKTNDKYLEPILLS
jgi:hypothetical protein